MYVKTQIVDTNGDLEMANKPTLYVVIDARSGITVKRFRSRDKATDFADQKDFEFGAVRYTVQPVWA